MEYITLTNSYAMMLVRLVISIAFTWFIIDKLYYAKSHRRDFRFTFMLIPVAIFFIVFFMIFVLEDMKGKASMGGASDSSASSLSCAIVPTPCLYAR